MELILVSFQLCHIERAAKLLQEMLCNLCRGHLFVWSVEQEQLVQTRYQIVRFAEYIIVDAMQCLLRISVCLAKQDQASDGLEIA